MLGAATGLGIHKAEGIWPVNMQGASTVPGLYVAGDGLASMLCGSSYVGLGFSLSGSAVQGADRRCRCSGVCEQHSGLDIARMMRSPLSSQQCSHHRER